MTVRQDLFQHTINSMRFGALQEELSEKLHECVSHAQYINKGTELTLKIKIKPNGSGQVELKDSVTQNLPQEEKGSTFMFSTPEGNLTQNAPTQQNLELQTVADDKPETFNTVEQ